MTKQEVWLLWEEDHTPWEFERTLIDIFTTEEIAQKHADECNLKSSKDTFKVWREKDIKRPDALPGYDLKQRYEYVVQAWDVSTE